MENMEVEDEHRDKVKFNTSFMDNLSALCNNNSQEVCETIGRHSVTEEDKNGVCLGVGGQDSGWIQSFEEFLNYQTHCDGLDRYICSECNIPKPTARLLDIHLQEVHDSFFELLAERQPMYECYVSDCNVKFKNPSERRQHCITLHEYSKNFRFDELESQRLKIKVNEDKRIFNEREVKLQKRKDIEEQSSTNKRQKAMVSISSNFLPNSSLAIKAESSLVFVPRQVTRKTSTMFTNIELFNRNILENESVMEVAELPGAQSS